MGDLHHRVAGCAAELFYRVSLCVFVRAGAVARVDGDGDAAPPDQRQLGQADPGDSRDRDDADAAGGDPVHSDFAWTGAFVSVGGAGRRGEGPRASAAAVVSQWRVLRAARVDLFHRVVRAGAGALHRIVAFPADGRSRVGAADATRKRGGNPYLRADDEPGDGGLGDVAAGALVLDGPWLH